MTDAIRTWSQYRASRRADPDALLLAQEEFFLGRMVQGGSERDKLRAVDELLSHNIRMVSAIAKRYKGRGCEHEDMMTDGMMGLHYAIQRYDPTKGHRFSTYATNWIRQAIGRGVENRGREIRLPSHVIAKITHIRISRQAYVLKHGEAPSMPELLVWILAPRAALKMQSMQKADSTLRSKTVQRLVLGFELEELLAALASRWHLPDQIVDMMLKNSHSGTRGQVVALAVNLARHSTGGWDNAALPDDFRAIARLLMVNPAQARSVVHAPPLDSIPAN